MIMNEIAELGCRIERNNYLDKTIMISNKTNTKILNKY